VETDLSLPLKARKLGRLSMPLHLEIALRTAIKMEREVHDFYAHAAKEAKGPHAKRLLEIFSREEQNHLKYLRTRLEEFERLKIIKLTEVASVIPPKERIAGLLATVGRNLEGRGELSDVHFLQAAFELERKTCAFYQDLVSRLDPDHQALFRRFLEIEESHLAMVKNELDAMNGVGRWLDLET
jgi:rubrerythrin